MDWMVRVGLVIAWRFAGSPTFLSPLFKNATIEGVVLLPSSFWITTGSLPSITATHELVVPKSIPIIFPIVLFLLPLGAIPVPPMPIGQIGRKNDILQNIFGQKSLLNLHY